VLAVHQQNNLVVAVIVDATCYTTASETDPRAGSKPPLAAELLAKARKARREAVAACGAVADAISLVAKSLMTDERAAIKATKKAAKKECDTPATCSPACAASSPDAAHGDDTAAAPGKQAKHYALHLIGACLIQVRACLRAVPASFWTAPLLIIMQQQQELLGLPASGSTTVQ
jgi:hypothetical protein